MDDVTKHTVDVGAAVMTAASVMHWMPEIAALLTAIWYVIRIGEWLFKKTKKLKDVP